MGNFIEDFKNFILEYVPTDERWAEAMAITVLSTTVGRKRVILSKIGDLHLNVWHLMVGPSGLAYKSAPILYFTLPTLAEFSKLINYPVIMPSRYSIEGFIEYMTQGYNWGCIIRDEFTALFKEVTSKQYLADAMEFMSELYDGMIQKRYTKKAKLEEVVDVYVVLTAATTPYLYKIMKPEFFMQGTGNRILYIIYRGKKRKLEANADEFFYGLDKRHDRLEKVQEFAKKLADLHKSMVTYLSPIEEAGEMWIEYKIEREDIAERRFRKDMYDITYSYIVRMPEMALKLSGLHALARTYEVLPKSNLDTLIISEEDMNWAINKINQHYKEFERMLEQWRTRPTPMQAKTLDEQTSLISNILKDNHQGLAWGQLRKLTKWNKTTWMEVIRYLWDTHNIIVVKEKRTDPGKPSTLIFHRIHLPFAKRAGEIIDSWTRVRALLFGW